MRTGAAEAQARRSSITRFVVIITGVLLAVAVVWSLISDKDPRKLVAQSAASTSFSATRYPSSPPPPASTTTNFWNRGKPVAPSTGHASAAFASDEDEESAPTSAAEDAEDDADVAGRVPVQKTDRFGGGGPAGPAGGMTNTATKKNQQPTDVFEGGEEEEEEEEGGGGGEGGQVKPGQTRAAPSVSGAQSFGFKGENQGAAAKATGVYEEQEETPDAQEGVHEAEETSTIGGGVPERAGPKGGTSRTGTDTASFFPRRGAPATRVEPDEPESEYGPGTNAAAEGVPAFGQPGTRVEPDEPDMGDEATPGQAGKQGGRSEEGGFTRGGLPQKGTTTTSWRNNGRTRPESPDEAEEPDPNEEESTEEGIPKSGVTLTPPSASEKAEVPVKAKKSSFWPMWGSSTPTTATTASTGTSTSSSPSTNEEAEDNQDTELSAQTSTLDGGSTSSSPTTTETDSTFPSSFPEPGSKPGRRGPTGRESTATTLNPEPLPSDSEPLPTDSEPLPAKTSPFSRTDTLGEEDVEENLPTRFPFRPSATSSDTDRLANPDRDGSSHFQPETPSDEEMQPIDAFRATARNPSDQSNLPDPAFPESNPSDQIEAPQETPPVTLPNPMPSTLVPQPESEPQELPISKQLGHVTPTKTGTWVLAKGFKYWLDRKLARAIGRFLTGKTVLEVGAGTGHYTQIFSEYAASIEGYDGVPNIEELTGGFIKRADFTEHLNLGVHDWVVCLDVGAHIPKEYELDFIDNLNRHNREGIILSWAVLGQKGKHHVNQHSNEYMKALLWPLGYDHDAETEQMFRRTAHLKWFKKSLMVFRKTERPNRRLS
eukprot:TRINITY_DN5787_c1_g1_i1.p1 TRINITY_DN5787_c1_g1~~TRINITY_DN5787_c1_g1_i1.p1  ORF type:complete len:825 (-),score=126.22 TRINITY_DN5787_c1_g1_i1:783-3257(-)